MNRILQIDCSLGNYLPQSLNWPVVLLIIFVCFTKLSIAQNGLHFQVDSSSSIENLSLKYIDSEDGLAQNEIVDMHLTKNKLLWLLTHSGISRYSGREIKNYNELEGKSLTRLKSGSIFQLSNNDAVCIFAPDIQIRIKEDSYGIELTPFDSAYHYGMRGAFTNHKILQRQFFHFLPTNSGNYYTFDNKLCYIHGDTIDEVELYSFNHFKRSNFFKLNERVFTITEDNQILEFTQTHIDTVLHSDFFKTDPSDYKIIDNQIVWKVGSDAVYYFKENNLYQLSLNKDSLTAKLLLKGIPRHNYTSIIVFEEEEKYFLGTSKSGMLQISRAVINQIEPDDYCGKDFANYAIVEIGEDSIMNANGLLYTPNFPVCDYVHNIELQPRTLVFKDDKEPVIIGTHDSTIFCIPITNVSSTHEINISDFTEGKKVWAKAFTKYKNQVVAYIHNKGIYEVQSDHIKLLIQTPNLGVVNQLKYFQDDILYLAHDQGLLKINVKTRRVLPIEYFDNIPVNSINLFNGQFWITSYGNGIYYGKKDNWKFFHPDNYPELKTTHAVWIENNNVFFTTNKGLFAFKTQDILKSSLDDSFIIQGYSFSQVEGLKYSEFNGNCQPAYLKTKSGLLAFPTLKGLTWLDVNNFNPEPIDSNFFVESVSVDGVLHYSTNALSVKHDYELIKLKITHPYYSNPENANTYYRIREISSEWELFDPIKSINIKRLPAKNYTVELTIPGSKSARTTTILKLEIVPPFYQTSVFFISIALGLLLIAILLIHYYRKAAQERQVALEEIIVERTLELSENNIKLSRILSTRNEMISIFSHDIRGPLRFLGDVATEINLKARKNNYNRIYSDLDYLLQSSESAFATADNILNWIKTTLSGNKSKIEIKLAEKIISILHQNKAALQKAQINTELDLDKSITTFYDKDAFNILLQNIIDNAIKFSNSLLRISLSTEGDRIRLIISDNGGGIQNDKLLKQLNKGEPVTSTPGKNSVLGVGVGLFIANELTRRNNGSIAFSNDDNGLIISISFLRDVQQT